MKFKEWLSLDELRYGGLYRQFRQQNPAIPDHVAKDLYNNRVGYTMKKLLNPKNPVQLPTQSWSGENTTGSYAGFNRTVDSPLPSNAPERIINGQDLSNIQWAKKPQPVTVTPLSFDEWTLKIMIGRRFGFREEKSIRNDANRMQTQRNLMPQEPNGKNEPIIMLKVGNKFRLMEGWHRTMTYLVFDHNDAVGAPPDQIEILKNGDLNQLDFSKWQPVVINAYVGTKPITTQAS